MDDLLQKYDTDGSISNLIEMERESPEAMLEPDDLASPPAGFRRRPITTAAPQHPARLL